MLRTEICLWKVLLGLESATENEVANRKSHHEQHHENDHDHDHDHDEFESFVVEVGAVENPAQFIEALKAIVEEHDVLRLKGFADVNGKPMRLLIQAVGGRIDQYYDREWGSDAERKTQLVVIGLAGLDRSRIESQLLSAAA